MTNFFHHSYSTVCVLVLALFLAACSTGIESTKTIKMSGSEKRASLPSAEDDFISALSPIPISEWKPSKNFLVTDNKVALLFDAALSDISFADSLKDKTISFNRLNYRLKPDGSQEAVIIFDWSGKQLVYPTNRNLETAQSSITGSNIPMLIDIDLVASCDSILKGKELWTRTGLWYDENLQPVNGRRFAKVSIDSVTPGNLVFPFMVHFTDVAGRHAHIPMNISTGSSLSDNRSFGSLFSLSDPRIKYPSISDEHWTLICNGQVEIGMTKDECRLSLGNPNDLDSGHDWNSTIDIWRYSDGRCLLFQDGLLTKIINGAY
jgi:hypothetical protein